MTIKIIEIYDVNKLHVIPDNTIGVYIINLKSGDCYIGKSICVKRRIYSHVKGLIKKIIEDIIIIVTYDENKASCLERSFISEFTPTLNIKIGKSEINNIVLEIYNDILNYSSNDIEYISSIAKLNESSVTSSVTLKMRNKKAIKGLSVDIYNFIRTKDGIETDKIGNKFGKKNDYIRPYLHRLKDYGFIIKENNKWYIS